MSKEDQHSHTDESERVRNHRSYRKASKRVEAYRQDPEKLRDLVSKASDKAGTKLPNSFEEIRDTVLALIRMIRAYSKKEYTDIPWKSVALIGASLFYFVMPFDLIPDFIIGIGLADDIALLAWTIKQVKTDIDRFRAWEMEKAKEIVVS